MNLLLDIPQDKLLHFVVGLLIYMAFHFIHPVVGLIAALIVGIGKECYDHFHKDKHTPDLNDALATLFGACIGYICSL
ncbi:hypothetical protein E0H86_07075 [Acinetobacter sp. ANC 4635]|uniref:hypothetical protein n=1 Tax=Acinetobacter sp. ANC 4635 TaxID=2529846 RepID=UPI00103D67EE|nr:hypothetical protein [Acinetobacter sp. ANC 4635]TCB32170.1 hypothetical protein E0H86_07075 [Acinetobacter sp. ANC 4635]